MTEKIRVGVIGAGYMGKAHSVALHAVGAVFNTPLRPVCELLCKRNEAEKAAVELGFARACSDWRELVADPTIEAIVIASPQETHAEIAMAAFAAGKPVLCEKPLAMDTDEALRMVAAAQGHVNMLGFNYVRTPATQFARQLIHSGEIGEIIYLRAEHAEDFLADADAPADWRTRDPATGNLGDLAPHAVNMALALCGPIESLVSDYQTVFAARSNAQGQSEAVGNDDQAQWLCRFASGAMGHVLSTRVAHGRKMGYAYEVHGTRGALRFDQEDQNALWLYRADASDSAGEQGFKKILTGPAHPDYQSFCLGPGHGTGYQDQIIIEQRDFLNAIYAQRQGETPQLYPSFADGLAVHRVIDAVYRSRASGQWERPGD